MTPPLPWCQPYLCRMFIQLLPSTNITRFMLKWFQRFLSANISLSKFIYLHQPSPHRFKDYVCIEILFFFQRKVFFTVTEHVWETDSNVTLNSRFLFTCRSPQDYRYDLRISITEQNCPLFGRCFTPIVQCISTWIVSVWEGSRILEKKQEGGGGEGGWVCGYAFCCNVLMSKNITGCTHPHE